MTRNFLLETQRKYHQGFIDEIKLIEQYKTSGYEAFRFHRHFVQTTMWPPLHSSRETQAFVRSLKVPKKDVGQRNLHNLKRSQVD